MNDTGLPTTREMLIGLGLALPLLLVLALILDLIAG
jgi:hypothetical protein